MTSLKLVAGTSLRQLHVILSLVTPTLTVNPNFFCTNNAPFATGNKRTTKRVVLKDIMTGFADKRMITHRDYKYTSDRQKWWHKYGDP